MGEELEDITAPSYKGDTVKGICPKCEYKALITRLSHEEPSWCPQPDVELESEEDRGHLTYWKTLECDECGVELMEGDDEWICPDCNTGYDL